MESGVHQGVKTVEDSLGFPRVNRLVDESYVKNRPKQYPKGLIKNFILI